MSVISIGRFMLVNIVCSRLLKLVLIDSDGVKILFGMFGRYDVIIDIIFRNG